MKKDPLSPFESLLQKYHKAAQIFPRNCLQITTFATCQNLGDSTQSTVGTTGPPIVRQAAYASSDAGCPLLGSLCPLTIPSHDRSTKRYTCNILICFTLSHELSNKQHSISEFNSTLTTILEIDALVTMRKILQITRYQVNSLNDEYIRNIPSSQRVCELSTPSPPSDLIDGIVARVTIKEANQTVFVEPLIRGVYLDNVRIQPSGSYECYEGNVIRTGSIHWNFRFISALHCPRYLLGPYVVPCEADMAVVTAFPNSDHASNIKGSVLGRDLLGDYRKVPLWLPGRRDADNLGAVLQRASFFNTARISSSWEAETAISVPYGPQTVFLDTLNILPSTVNHLNLVVNNPCHLHLLKDCLKAASQAHSITSVTVTGSAGRTMLRVNADTAGWSAGNLTTFRWINVHDERSSKLVRAVMDMNPMLRKLAIGGRYVTSVVPLMRYRRHLCALELHLSDVKDPEVVLQMIKPPAFELEELCLVFEEMPKASWIRKLCGNFASYLRKVTVTVNNPRPHPECGPLCDTHLFPSMMPALQEVAFENVICSSSAMAHSMLFETLTKLSIRGANGDTSTFSQFCYPHLYETNAFSVETLSVHPGARVRDLIIMDHSWDRLNNLTVQDLQLSDVPAVLKLARRASSLTLVVSLPSQQIGPPSKFLNDSENTIADQQFVGDDVAFSSLRHCIRLEELKIVFSTQIGDEWLHPTLGLYTFTRGLSHLRALRHVQMNEISFSLLAALQQKQQRNPGFTFNVTLHSAIKRGSF